MKIVDDAAVRLQNYIMSFYKEWHFVGVGKDADIYVYFCKDHPLALLGRWENFPVVLRPLDHPGQVIQE